MKRLLTVLCLVGLAAGPALANNPEMSVGPVNPDPSRYTCSNNQCQYGFVDMLPGQGWTLDNSQQLGIQCNVGNMTITDVGFWSEFVMSPGPMNVVINGTTVGTFQTEVPGDNNLHLATPFPVSGPACIMLCPVGGTALVTGEDTNSAPYGNTYWSSNCTCQNAFTDNNLTIWACYDQGTPTQETTWGQIRMMYH